MKLIKLFLLLILLIISYTHPVLAANKKISPRVEQQILQVIKEHPEVIIESVQNYQLEQQRKLQQVQQEFSQSMLTNPQTIIGESPQTGAKNLKYLLIEFSDFQCPYCSKLHQTLNQFLEKHPDQLTLVYKHYPLSNIHPEAIPAARASYAAYKQGKFWEYHNALFDQQSTLGEPLYIDIAQKLNLDIAQFNLDRQSADFKIIEDIQLGDRLGITATPFLIMNGKPFSGAISLNDLEKILSQVPPIASQPTTPTSNN